jgi:methylmalonyl-CoA mutase C-terminal domain/subunit
MNGKRIKVLIAKPGLDGHDVGAKIVVRTLMDAGFDVIYTGLRQSAEDIAAAARDDDVDVIGLSILSGSHLPLCRKFAALRDEYGLTGTLWVVGGSIPQTDVAALERLGVDGVFPFGTPLPSIVEFIEKRVT